MSDWELLTDETAYTELVNETYQEGEYSGDPPEKYPCLALAEVDESAGSHYFYYVYVADAAKLLGEHYAQREAEEGSYTDFPHGTSHELHIFRASNGFIMKSVEHYTDSEGVRMEATTTNVAVTEGSFIDMFASYASQHFLKEGLLLRLLVVKPEKDDEEHEVLL